MKRGFADDTRRLIDAATRGREVLDRAVAGEDVGEVTKPSTEAEDASAFVSSIKVEGFRGIGPKSSLLLTPGPGLTLVVLPVHLLGTEFFGRTALASNFDAPSGKMLGEEPINRLHGFRAADPCS